MLKETDFKNYSFIQKEEIEELNGYGYVLEHKKTGMYSFFFFLAI